VLRKRSRIAQQRNYASSFKRTGVSYPGWAVGAENVTDRYAVKAAAGDPARFRMMVKVLDHLAGKRIATQGHRHRPH